MADEPFSVWTFLRRAIEQDPSEFGPAENIRALVTWVFNLARNILLVGAIRFFYIKSHSPVLHAADIIASVALVSFILTYWSTWNPRIFRQFFHGRMGILGDALLEGMIVAVWLMYSFPAVNAVVDAIANAQAVASPPR
jgi:hypothetical protein